MDVGERIANAIANGLPRDWKSTLEVNFGCQLSRLAKSKAIRDLGLDRPAHAF